MMRVARLVHLSHEQKKQLQAAAEGRRRWMVERAAP